MQSKFWLLFLLVGMTAFLCLCTQKPNFEKPTVTIDDIMVQSASANEIEFIVRIIVDNPNPFGIKAKKLVFDLYYNENGEWKYLGHGEKADVEIRKQGLTAIEIPVVVENKRLISALIELGLKGSLDLKASGSAYIDVKVRTIEVPFETTKTVSTEKFRGAKISIPVEKQTEKPQVLSYEVTTPTPTPTPTPTEEGKKKLTLMVEPSPAKVGQEVTIKVVDEQGNPVPGAWVGYIEVGKAVFTGNVIENLHFIGRTDEKGEIKYKFTIPDIYFIGAKKIGYVFNYTKLRVKLLL